MLEVLEKAMTQYGVSGYIRSDNGSEFKVQASLKDHHVKTIYIDPGSPGKMAISKAFIVDFETNIWIESGA